MQVVYSGGVLQVVDAGGGNLLNHTNVAARFYTQQLISMSVEVGIPGQGTYALEADPAAYTGYQKVPDSISQYDEHWVLGAERMANYDLITTDEPQLEIRPQINGAVVPLNQMQSILPGGAFGGQPQNSNIAPLIFVAPSRYIGYILVHDGVGSTIHIIIVVEQDGAGGLGGE